MVTQQHGRPPCAPAPQRGALPSTFWGGPGIPTAPWVTTGQPHTHQTQQGAGTSEKPELSSTPYPMHRKRNNNPVGYK